MTPQFSTLIHDGAPGPWAKAWWSVSTNCQMAPSFAMPKCVDDRVRLPSRSLCSFRLKKLKSACRVRAPFVTCTTRPFGGLSAFSLKLWVMSFGSADEYIAIVEGSFLRTARRRPFIPRPGLKSNPERAARDLRAAHVHKPA